MTSRVIAAVLRLVFAAASLGAVAFQLFAVHVPSGGSPAGFFACFTILANVLISVVFTVSAIRLLARRRRPGVLENATRGMAVVYIVFVGLVFTTVLRHDELPDLTPMVDAILRFALPVAGVVDWLLWPPRTRLPFRVVAWWMVSPAVYIAVSLAVGATSGAYLYPFFDPRAAGGADQVALNCGMMLAGFLLIGVIVWLIGVPRRRRAPQSRMNDVANQAIRAFGSEDR